MSKRENHIDQFELDIEHHKEQGKGLKEVVVSEVDEKIFQEISKGNFENVPKLTILLARTAERLAEWEGLEAKDYFGNMELFPEYNGIRVLPLESLTDLEDTDAERLAHFKGKVIVPKHLQYKVDEARTRLRN